MTEPEETIDVPLTYPLVSVVLRTTQMIEGKPIYSECEEVLNLKVLGNDTPKAMNKLMNDFRTYLKRLRDTINSSEGQERLAQMLQPVKVDPSL